MNESNFHRMARRIDEMVERLLGRHTAEFCPTHAWVPAVNVYLLPDRAAVCIELAGIERESIDLQVTPRGLTVRGVRTAPPPESQAHEPVQMVIMEIDYGPFEREIRLPHDVDVDRVEAKLAGGLMWVTLPWRESEGGAA
jgi:HSP20 family protein